MGQPLMHARGLSINQPTYLTNNWRAFQNDQGYGFSKVIKIQDGVVTLISRTALLRCKISGILDGFYEFNDDGYLNFTDFGEMRSFHPGYNSFPDPEVLRPRFEMLTHTPPIHQAEVRTMVDFLSHCRSELDVYSEGNLLVFFEDDSLVCHNRKDLWLKVSCPVPVNSHHGLFQANRLRLILIDMLRYDQIFMGIDLNKIPTDQFTPLVIGVDWSSCGLIKPT